MMPEAAPSSLDICKKYVAVAVQNKDRLINKHWDTWISIFLIYFYTKKWIA